MIKRQKILKVMTGEEHPGIRSLALSENVSRGSFMRGLTIHLEARLGTPVLPDWRVGSSTCSPFAFHCRGARCGQKLSRGMEGRKHSIGDTRPSDVAWLLLETSTDVAWGSSMFTRVTSPEQ